MGYALAHGRCIGCQKLFSFNPVRVPSLRVNGSREPVCKSCTEVYNSIRKKKGLPLFDPAPDAYDAIDERELP